MKAATHPYTCASPRNLVRLCEERLSLTTQRPPMQAECMDGEVPDDDFFCPECAEPRAQRGHVHDMRRLRARLADAEEEILRLRSELEYAEEVLLPIRVSHCRVINLRHNATHRRRMGRSAMRS